MACLKETIPGKDNLSKSMMKMVEYRQELHHAFEQDAQGSNADTTRNRAEWARFVAAELRRQGTKRSKELTQAKGEAVSPQTEPAVHDTFTVPDLAAVEASFERTRLLLSSGPNVAALGVDAADSIQARNSLEKMLAHQLAATHELVMEQIGLVHFREEPTTQAKRLTAVARCLRAYQQGLLTLQKLRQNGNQRITVQYVNVSHGSQAVLGDVVKVPDQP